MASEDQTDGDEVMILAGILISLGILIIVALALPLALKVFDRYLDWVDEIFR